MKKQKLTKLTPKNGKKEFDDLPKWDLKLPKWDFEFSEWWKFSEWEF